MKVNEIPEGKKAVIVIDCDVAHVYYPRAGQEKTPESDCNCMMLDTFQDMEDEPDALSEASGMLDIPEADIAVEYN